MRGGPKLKKQNVLRWLYSRGLWYYRRNGVLARRLFILMNVIRIYRPLSPRNKSESKRLRPRVYIYTYIFIYIRGEVIYYKHAHSIFNSVQHINYFLFLRKMYLKLHFCVGNNFCRFLWSTTETVDWNSLVIIIIKIWKFLIKVFLFFFFRISWHYYSGTYLYLLQASTCKKSKQILINMRKQKAGIEKDNDDGWIEL